MILSGVPRRHVEEEEGRLANVPRFCVRVDGVASRLSFPFGEMANVCHHGFGLRHVPLQACVFAIVVSLGRKAWGVVTTVTVPQAIQFMFK